MKLIKDKQLVVGADFAGYPLKEAVVTRLNSKPNPTNKRITRGVLNQHTASLCFVKYFAFVLFFVSHK